MADIRENTNYLDFYTINADYMGSRQVKNEQETVAFHDSSTMRIWYNEQSDNYRQHWHTAIEIIMPVENYYDAKINDTLYHIMPGEVLVIPPGEIHELKAPETGKRFIFLFDITLITKQMRNEYFNKNEFAELVIYSLLLNFFVKFGYNRNNTENLFPNVRLYKQKEYVQKFNNLMDYIDEHYMEDLNLEDIAESIGFSKFHFSRLFKQYTNFTFCDYLCYRRIKVAEELLAKPDLSITEIALQAGFPSISTFNRLFKQHKNCTPSEYRAKNRVRHNLT